MRRSVRLGAVLGLGVLGMVGAAAAHAADHCVAHTLLAGNKVEMTHCAISYFDDQHSVTIWFDPKPISAEDAAKFGVSAYEGDRGVQVAFCPGGGDATPAPAKVPWVNIDIADGPSWVFNIPKDHDVKVDRMSGQLALGGRLAGHLTVQHTSDGKPYSLDVDFDVTLPAKNAMAGVDCTPQK